MAEEISREKLILLTPIQAEQRGARDISEEIIQKLTLLEEINVIAIGASIQRVISAVNISSDIANVNVASALLDYVPIPIYGNEKAAFITLSRTPQEANQIVTEFEERSFDFRNDRTVWVRRGDEVSRTTNNILFKLSKFEEVRIAASGFAIMAAVDSTLQVIKSGISKFKVGISAIILKDLERKGMPERKVPAIDIYLQRDMETEYPEHHEILKNMILKG